MQDPSQRTERPSYWNLALRHTTQCLQPLGDSQRWDHWHRWRADAGECALRCWTQAGAQRLSVVRRSAARTRRGESRVCRRSAPSPGDPFRPKPSQAFLRRCDISEFAKLHNERD